MNEKKTIVTEFLRICFEGNAHEAVEQYCTPDCRHHSAYFPAGMNVLADAMNENARQNPNRSKSTKHILADGDMVSVHSHVILKPGELEIATAHLFRLEDDKIAEMWDLGMIIPKDVPNQDGMF